jgi:hypothetical protein
LIDANVAVPIPAGVSSVYVTVSSTDEAGFSSVTGPVTGYPSGGLVPTKISLPVPSGPTTIPRGDIQQVLRNGVPLSMGGTVVSGIAAYGYPNVFYR